MIARYFNMRAKDGNAAELTWRTWVVKGKPDATGERYFGPFAGSRPNLQDITIAAQWEAPE